jgi:hypothetical protein
MCFKTYPDILTNNFKKSRRILINGGEIIKFAFHASTPMKPTIITLPKICDPRGNLTFVQDNDQLPFSIARTYWIYDVPAGAERGGHSHHRLQQLLVAASGSFNVNISDGFTEMTYSLNRPYEGLYLPPGIWRGIDNFASGSVCLSIVNMPYEEEDYVRDFDEFLALAKKKGPVISKS